MLHIHLYLLSSWDLSLFNIEPIMKEANKKRVPCTKNPEQDQTRTSNT